MAAPTNGRYRLRAREDGVLLLVTLLLLAVVVRAAIGGLVLVASVAAAFAALTALIVAKKMQARWCGDCGRGMAPRETPGTFYRRRTYECEGCGNRQDSGVNVRWPD